MKLDSARIEVGTGAGDAYRRLTPDRQRTLVAPEDDMWATFADMAEPYSLTLGTQLVGRFSVDDDAQLHGFHLSDDLEDAAADVFDRIVSELNITAAVASTVDPRFLALSLTRGGAPRPVALMYDLATDPESDETVAVRLATSADHAAAVDFYQAETGSPEAFLTSFLAERIDLQELHLVEADGRITATGECRADHRSPGNAHLGLVVSSELRGRGIGSRLMHSLAEICTGHDMTPRCSTEPTNVAAQSVIRRAGFRNRHQIFRIAAQ
ncbi:MAG: GNAT family N-acetyltransferase [Acidimicrobiales bacterium]